MRKAFFSLILQLLTLLVAPSCFADQVRVLDEPITVYYWLNNATLGKLAAKPSIFKQKAYQALVKEPIISLSSDPVSSRAKGGQNDSWVLFEIKLNAGTRLLDLRTPQFQSTSEAKLEALVKSLPTDLAVSGIEYPHEETPFSECRLPERNIQIAIIRHDAIDPANIKVFNHFSKDQPEDRLRIQAIFYKADYDRTFSGGAGDPMYPKRITRLNPPFSGGGRGLLWEDLDEMEIDPASLGTWLKQNLSGCNSPTPDASRTLSAEPRQ